MIATIKRCKAYKGLTQFLARLNVNSYCEYDYQYHLFFILQNEKLRCLSKSVAELGLNKDLPNLLSDPIQRTNLPFLVNTAILSFVTAFEKKKKLVKKKIAKNDQDVISARFHIPGDFTYQDCHE